MPKGIPKIGKGGQFQKGEAASDPRRNQNGQRNRAAVKTAAQARELYVQVLAEPINTPLNAEMTNLEMIVRQHVSSAKKGDAQAREQMFDRIWGKSLQPIKHEFDELSDGEIIRRAAAVAATIATGFAGIASPIDEARPD